MDERDIDRFYEAIAELARRYGPDYALRVHDEFLRTGWYEDRRVRIRVTRDGSIEVLFK